MIAFKGWSKRVDRGVFKMWRLRSACSILLASVLVISFQNCGSSVKFAESKSQETGGEGHEGKLSLLIDKQELYDSTAQPQDQVYVQVSEAPSCKVAGNEFADFLGTIYVNPTETRLYCSSEDDAGNPTPPVSGPFDSRPLSALGFTAYDTSLLTSDSRLYASELGRFENTKMYCRSAQNSSSATGVDVRVSTASASTVVPTLDHTFVNGTLPASSTFTRSSSATYLDGSGLVATAAANEARWSFEGITRKGLLLEGPATNLIARSNEFNTSPWYLVKSQMIFDASVQNPTGQMGAFRLRENAEMGYHRVVQSVTMELNKVYTFSAYVKEIGTGRDVSVRITNHSWQNGKCLMRFKQDKVSFNVDPALRGCTLEKLANGWYRIAVVMNSGTGNKPAQINMELSTLQNGPDHEDLYLGNGNASAAIWGAQFEANEGPTSYIPTTATIQTRGEDRLVVNAAGLTQHGVTLFSRWMPTAFVAGSQASAFHVTGEAGSTTQFSVKTSRNGAVQIAGPTGMLIDSVPHTLGGIAQQAVSFDDSSVRGYLNGEPVGTAAGALQAGVDRFVFASSSSGANQMVLAQLRAYPAAFTNEEMAFATSLEQAPTLTLSTLILGVKDKSGDYSRLTTSPIVVTETADDGFVTTAHYFNLMPVDDQGGYVLKARLSNGVTLDSNMHCYTIRPN